MTKSLYDILSYIDSVDPTLGDDLYVIIEEIKNNDPSNKLLEGGVVCSDSRILVLEDEQDFFLVRKFGNFKRITEYNKGVIIGRTTSHDLAFYVQHEGRYAHIVGALEDSTTDSLKKIIPPL